MIGYVYGIVCPFLNVVVYVGSTINTVEHRMYQHKMIRQSSKLLEYLDELGKDPIVITIEVVRYNNVDRLRKREAFWISAFSKNGALLNRAYNQCNYEERNNLIKRLREAKVRKKEANKRTKLFKYDSFVSLN